MSGRGQEKFDPIAFAYKALTETQAAEHDAALEAQWMEYNEYREVSVWLPCNE